jgi:hypothetical protein
VSHDPELPAAPLRDSRSRWLLSLLWPLVLLWPCLFGSRTFLPYDLAQYPPKSLSRTEGEVAAMQAESNYDVTETPIWFVPELKRAGATLRHEGALPNWNPTARTGTALLPHGHDAILYPLTWPALLIEDPARWLGWLAFLNLATAAILMRGFLRALRLRDAAAWLGSVAFSMSTTLAANAHNFPRLSSLVWLPGMLWALRAAHDLDGPRRIRALCGFSIAFALTWIGGFPPYALPCSAIAAIYGIALVLTDVRSRGMRAAWTRALPVAFAAGIGVLLCAHYLLPAFAFFGESARSLAPDLERVSQSAFDAYGLLGWIAPDVFGRPDLGAALPYGNAPLPLMLGSRESLSGTPLLPNFNATEYALFSGSAALWLALCGLLHKRAPHRFLPLALLVACIGMALFAEPFWRLFALPGVRIVPPLRWLGPVALLLAWLSAQGLHAMLQHGERARLVAAVACALVVAIACFALQLRFSSSDAFRDWGLADQLAARYAASAPDPASITPLRIEQLVLRGPNNVDYAQNGAKLASESLLSASLFHALAAIALAALLVTMRNRARIASFAAFAIVLMTGLDLARAGRTFARGIRGTGDSRTEAHELFAHRRLELAESGGFMIARVAPWQSPATPPEPSFLPPGTLGPDGIRDLQVYTYFDTRSIQPWAAMLDAAIGSGAGTAATAKGYLTASLPDHPGVLAHPLLDACGVRYLCSTTPLQHASTTPTQAITTERGAFYIYERPTAMPRAFCVAGVEPQANDADVVAAMANPAWQPRATAFIAREDASSIDFPARDASAGTRTVTFTRDDANEIVLQVADGPRATLVLADTFFSGWSARLERNGVAEPLPIARINHAMRGVVVPEGSATVVFSYTPTRQRLGFALFAIGAAFLGIVLHRTRTSRPAGTRVETPT